MDSSDRFKFADLLEANFRFAVDSMYGSGRGVLTGIFQNHGITPFFAFPALIAASMLLSTGL